MVKIATRRDIVQDIGYQFGSSWGTDVMGDEPAEPFDGLDLLAGRPLWQSDAACKEHDPKLWFPERGADLTKPLAVCESCLVKAECRAWAMEQGPELHGIFGGLSARGRAQLHRANTVKRPRRVWTTQEVSDALAGWLAANERRTKAAYKDAARGSDLPSLEVIRSHIGSWSEALVALGYDQPITTVRWTVEAITAAVSAWLATSTNHTHRAYRRALADSAAGTLPDDGTVMKRLGVSTWEQVVELLRTSPPAAGRSRPAA